MSGSLFISSCLSVKQHPFTVWQRFALPSSCTIAASDGESFPSWRLLSWFLFRPLLFGFIDLASLSFSPCVLPMPFGAAVFESLFHQRLFLLFLTPGGRFAYRGRRISIIRTTLSGTPACAVVSCSCDGCLSSPGKDSLPCPRERHALERPSAWGSLFSGWSLSGKLSLCYRTLFADFYRYHSCLLIFCVIEVSVKIFYYFFFQLFFFFLSSSSFVSRMYLLLTYPYPQSSRNNCMFHRVPRIKLSPEILKLKTDILGRVKEDDNPIIIIEDVWQ